MTNCIDCGAAMTADEVFYLERTYSKCESVAFGLVDAGEQLGEMNELRARIAALETDNAQLHEAITESLDIKVKRFHLDENGCDITLQSPMIQMIGELLAKEFKAIGAVNFLSFECGSEELGPMLLTLQRVMGDRPDKVAAELRVENARLRKIEVAAQIANNEIRRFGLSSSVEPRQELFDAGRELDAALALQPGDPT